MYTTEQNDRILQLKWPGAKYRDRAIVHLSLSDQFQPAPRIPKPDTSTRIYVPQNNKTLFMAHLLACG